IAEELGSAFSRSIASTNLGIIHTVAGEYEPAERCLLESLELARSRRLGLEFEAYTLLSLARAQLGLNNHTGASRSAEEAVALAQERGQRYWELLAQVTFAEALTAESGARARSRVELALDHAAALIHSTAGHAME